MFRDQLRNEERVEKYGASLRVVEDPLLDIIDLHRGDPVIPRNQKRTALTTSADYPLEIVVANKLFKNEDRNCLHVELDTLNIPAQVQDWRPSGSMASNPISEVNRLLNVLELHERKDIPLLISSLDPNIQSKMPSPTTLAALFQNYLEICAPVARETIISLAQFAPSAASKASLFEIASSRETYHPRQAPRISHVTIRSGTSLIVKPYPYHSSSRSSLP
jgi:NADPH-ferrihemoprotein reductase